MSNPAPAIDQTSKATGFTTTTSSSFSSAVTLGANEVCLIFVFTQSTGGYKTVSSISGGSFEGSWTQRKQGQSTGPWSFPIDATWYLNYEIWWNYTGSSGFSDQTITVDLSAAVQDSTKNGWDYAVVQWAGITGAANPASPFDTNSNFPIFEVYPESTSSTGPTYSTNNNNDLLIQGTVCEWGNVYDENFLGVSTQQDSCSANGAGALYIQVSYQTLSSVQSASDSAQLNGSAQDSWFYYLDAIAGTANVTSLPQNESFIILA